MARKTKDPEVGHDVLRRYLCGGIWKRRLLEKAGKGRSERTKLSRTYTAYPPADGWKGGPPEQNGWKAGKK